MATYLNGELESFIPASYSGARVTYDNTSSGMTATNMQDAVDELNSEITSVSSKINVTSGSKSGNTIVFPALSNCLYEVFILGNSNKTLSALIMHGNVGTVHDVGLIGKYVPSNIGTDISAVAYDNGNIVITMTNTYFYTVKVLAMGGI